MSCLHNLMDYVLKIIQKLFNRWLTLSAFHKLTVPLKVLFLLDNLFCHMQSFNTIMHPCFYENKSLLSLCS